MKVSKISIVIVAISVFWIILATVRWFFMYPDMSQFILAIAIGGIMAGSAYMYNWMRLVDESFKTHEKRIDAIVTWWTKHELMPEDNDANKTKDR